jgi:hypothetical protein
MKHLLVIAIAAIGMISCNKNKNEIVRISTDGKVAESVYLTHDAVSHPVVAWTERNASDLTFVYVVLSDDGHSISDRRELPLDAQVATHAEGMPKVAFKEDGTVIVAYEKKAPTSDNKYAGMICYRASNDRGETWSQERYIHGDTISGLSHSYFDIEKLPDGEVGASWLDIKLYETMEGRSVRFARTNSQNQFSEEILIDSSACQCCRTDVYADANGKVNIAYRGLKSGPLGQTIRDMMIATSLNNGLSFSFPKMISSDNWNIDGCPHTGPALCSGKGNLQALWYTEGHGTGIYYAHKEDTAIDFAQKQLISVSGRHPQASSNNDRVALVWEETTKIAGKNVTEIHCQLNTGESVLKSILTPETSNAFLPVITSTKMGFIVAFLMEENGKARTCIKSL